MSPETPQATPTTCVVSTSLRTDSQPKKLDTLPWKSYTSGRPPKNQPPIKKQRAHAIVSQIKQVPSEKPPLGLRKRRNHLPQRNPYLLRRAGHTKSWRSRGPTRCPKTRGPTSESPPP